MSPVLFAVRREHIRDALILAALLFAVSALMHQAFALGFHEGQEARGIGKWVRTGQDS